MVRIHIPPFLHSFYFLSSVALAVWLAFFDSNDIVSQVQRRRELARMEEERDYFKTKTKQVDLEREALLTNPDLLERFARERYLMKRPHETVFVVVRDTVEADE